MRAVRKRLTRERGGVRYARCSPGAAWPCTPCRPGSEPGRGPGPLHAKRASLTVWKPCQRITWKMVQSCCSYSFDNKSKINITLWRWRRAIGKKKAPNVAGALVRNAVYLDIFHSEVTLGFEGPQEWLVGQLDSECVFCAGCVLGGISSDVSSFRKKGAHSSLVRPPTVGEV